MLLSFLVASALVFPQAPAATPPAQDAGSSATDTANATPDTVRDFLADAQAQLYDPRDHGLETLAFVAPLEIPVTPQTITEIGTIHVSWAAGEDPSVEPRVVDELPPELAAQVPEPFHAQILAQFSGILASQGEMFLAYSLGDLFATLLTSHVGSLGTAEGMLSVAFTPRADVEAGGPPVTWLFDDEGVPQVSIVEVEQPAPMGGTMTLNVRVEHDWRAGPDGALVLAEARTVTSVGGQQQGTEVTTFERRDLGDGLLVLAAVHRATSAVGGQQVELHVPFRELTVNGSTVAAPAEPREAAGKDGGAGQSSGG